MKPGRRRNQQGAVIVTVCLMMLFLLGVMAFALDLTRTFVVKSELQTAMDSCALSAAKELDGTASAITRATNAGMTAGNLNRVRFQSANWGGAGQIVAGNISFRNATYTPTTAPAAARYVECTHTQTGVQLWLLQALQAFSSDPTFTNTQDVMARAVAKRTNAQTSCPLPLALKPKAGGTAPDYGFTNGEWVTLLMGPGEATNGQIGWANLDGSNNAAETQAEMKGRCGTKVGDKLGTPGVQTAVADEWNSRFGIYRNTGDPAVDHPDYTGYSYTATNWPARSNAYSGSSGGSEPTADNFQAKRASFASCDDQGTRLRGANSCESITGLNLGSFQRVATPGSAGQHGTLGQSRRIVLVPVVNGGMQVIDYSCMLMLQPLSIPMAPVQLEYLGNAGLPGSPCSSGGLPGGAAGPLVPALGR
jgi:Flp pilus assembly protein TadG